MLDQCHHIPDNHYNRQASHYHHQQSYSNTTTGIGKKRSRGRPRLNEANNNSNNKSTSRHSISKSLIQSLLAKLPSSASLISRIPCVEQSLISTSPSSATTVMKRGRGRPKSLKTLLKEAEMAGLEIPLDVIEALMTNQQQCQRARHSQQQKRESFHYYSDQLDHHSIQDDHHLLLHSQNPQHLPPSFQQQSYSNSNQTEHGFITQQDQIQYNISSQRSEPRFSYHQYQSKQHKALPWMNQQQQPQTTFHSLSDNMNSDNFIHHQQSISDGKFLHSEINSQQPRDLPNGVTRKHILYNINNNNHNNHNDNKVIEQYETEIVKNPFDDLDDSMSLQSSSMKNLSIKSNNDVKTVAPIRISLTNNSLFNCPSSTATRSILAQQEQELQSQSAKRKRSNFSENLFSDNDDEDDDTYDDDSNESTYSTPSSFEDDDDDDDDTHDNDRNKRRKHQDNDIDQYFSVSKSPFNTSIQTDISRKSNYSHKRQQYTLTGKPKFTESIMMDCLNASLIGDKDNDDDDVNDELLDNFKFNHADYDEEASKKCHEMQEDTPKLPKLLLKRLDSDDNGFKIIQNSCENEKEIEINNNPESKSETVKKLTIRFSTNGEARVDQNGNNSNEMTSCLEKSICNELVEQICSSTTENTEITLPNIKSINQISDDKDNICYQQATNSPENAITNALIDDSQQDAFENNEMNSATVKEVTSILSTNPVDENPLFRTPSPPPAFDRSTINLANHPSSSMESILPINCLDTTKLISDNEQFSAINSIMNLDDFEPNESPSQEIEVNPLISNRSNLVDNLKNIENVGNSDNVDYVFDQNDGECNIGIQEQKNTEQSTDKQTEKFFESSKSTEIDTTTESFIQGQGGHNDKTKSIESSIVDNIVKNVADSNEQNLLNVDNKDLLNNDIDMKTFSPDLEEPKPLSPYSSPKHIQSTVNSALITNTTTNIAATVSMPTPIQSISHHIDELQINSSNIQLPPQLLQSNLSSVNQVMASQTSSKSPVPNSIYIQQQSVPSKGFPLQQQQPQPHLPVFHFPPNSAIRLLAPSVSPQIQHSSTVHPQHNVRPAFLFQSAEQNLGFHAPTQQPQFMIRGPFAPPRHQPSFQPPQMIKTQTPNGSTINLILSHPNTPSPCSYTVRPPPSQAGTALLNPVFSNSINQPMFIRNGPRLIPVNPGLMNTMRMFAPGQPHRPNPQAFFTMAAPISSSQHLIQQQQTIRQHQQQVAFQQHRLTSTPIFFSSPITNQKVILEAKPSTMIKDELNPSTRQLPIKDILTEAMEEIRFDDIDDQPDNSNQQPQAHSKIMKVSDTVRLSSPVINPNNSHPTFINQMSSAMTSQSLIRSTSQVWIFNYFMIKNINNFFPYLSLSNVNQ